MEIEKILEETDELLRKSEESTKEEKIDYIQRAIILQNKAIIYKLDEGFQKTRTLINKSEESADWGEF